MAEFGRSSFLRNLHLKLSTFSSSFFDFPEISMENVTADPRGLFLTKFLPSYLKKMRKLIFFSLFYNILPKSCSLLGEKGVEIRWLLEKAEKSKIRGFFSSATKTFLIDCQDGVPKFKFNIILTYFMC